MLRILILTGARACSTQDVADADIVIDLRAVRDTSSGPTIIKDRWGGSELVVR